METIVEVVKGIELQVSVVIPAHNEAKNLPYVLPLIPNWVHEVILVNDHSTDATIEVATRVLPNIRILNTQVGRGKGAALQAGFAAVTGDIIVMMDADGSNDPREIPHFLEVLLSGAYFALGSRFAKGGGSKDITPLRRVGAGALIFITNLLFGTRLTDLFCGLNAFWENCLDFFEIDCDGFDVETLMILRVCKANLEIVEVPCYEHARIHGKSNFHTFEDGWRVLKMIIQEWRNGRVVVGKVKMHYRSLEKNVPWDDLALKKQTGAT